jgi:hypothetical protein
MVPQGFAAPNAALNSTINRGQALSKKLALLGIIVTSLDINPVGSTAVPVPLSGVSIPNAQALGVTVDDLVHLVFSYIGSQGNQAEVAVIEQLIAPATVGAVVALFTGLFPAATQVQADGRALSALAGIPAVTTALHGALS